MAREGKHTCLQSSSLLQHLGLVGATGPHSWSKGEYHYPLVQLGMRARQQAHIKQQVRSRCGRARAQRLAQTPRDPYHPRKFAMRRYRKPPA